MKAPCTFLCIFCCLFLALPNCGAFVVGGTPPTASTGLPGSDVVDHSQEDSTETGSLDGPSPEQGEPSAEAGVEDEELDERGADEEEEEEEDVVVVEHVQQRQQRLELEVEAETETTERYAQCPPFFAPPAASPRGLPVASA